MSRLYISNARGRQAMFAGSRTTRTSSNLDGTYQDKPQRKRKGGSKYGVTTPTNSRRRKAAAMQHDDESTTSGASETEADEDESDDDNDEPEVLAPSRAFKQRAAGRYQYDRSDDNLSEIGDEDSLFNERHLSTLPGVTLNNGNDEEEEDDEIYQKVDDISESDPENVSQDEMLRLEVELNLNRSLSAATDDEDPSAFYLNQIEGMSAYGFGETSEAEGSVHLHMSSQSSDDDGTPTFQRHVRFEETFPESKPVFRLSQSPTMTRALLPSALPPHGISAVVEAEYGAVSESNSDIDSDVTDDCLPAAALEMSDDEQPPEDTSSTPDARKTPKLKGPPTGRFIDDGDKSAGILDPTGKVLIITNPHSLGEEFVRRYGPSAPASPGAGFAEAVFGDEDSQSVQDATAQLPDPMMSSLTTDSNIASNGQPMGPPEAWYADFKLIEGMLPEDDTDADGLDAAEQMINLEDVIQFGSDESDVDSPTSPSFMSSDFNLTPRNQVSHLDSSNIMSFRRAADPAFAALQSSPPTASSGFFATPKMSRNRKRKARNDSPYSTPLYKGVTPVQRTTGFHHGATILMDSPAPSKRRRIMS